MAPIIGVDATTLRVWAGKLDTENHDSAPKLKTNAELIGQSAPAFLGPAAAQFTSFITTVVQLQTIGTGFRLTQLANGLRANAGSFKATDGKTQHGFTSQLPGPR